MMKRSTKREQNGGWGQYSKIDDENHEKKDNADDSQTGGQTSGQTGGGRIKRLTTAATGNGMPYPTISRRISSNSMGTSCPDFGSLSAATSRIKSSGITFSEAKGEIWKQRLRGGLMKRGFRHRRAWVARWVVLSGRMLAYYSAAQEDVITTVRGRLELTKDTLVAFEDDGHFGFAVFPLGESALPNVTSNHSSTDLLPIQHAVETDSDDEDDPRERDPNSIFSCGATSSTYSARRRRSSGRRRPSTVIKVTPSNNTSSWFGSVTDLFKRGAGDLGHEEVWHFRARSAEERETWVRAIHRVVALVKRVDMSPTLIGVGSILDHYTFKQDIGTGRFGTTVKLVEAKFQGSTGSFFAVKVLNLAKKQSSSQLNGTVYTTASGMEQSPRDIFKQELRTLKKIQRVEHPNICRHFQTFEDNHLVYFVMEYLSGGSLQQRLDGRGPYDEADAADLVFQLAGALKELHSAGIVVCDMNPSNLLFENERPEARIKIVEFSRAQLIPIMNPLVNVGHGAAAVSRKAARGNSRSFDVGGGGNVDEPVKKKPVLVPTLVNYTHAAQYACTAYLTVQQLLGLPGFVPPEAVSHKQYSFACDLWALGCITFTAVSGTPPFFGPDALKQTLKGISSKRLGELPISNAARHAISRMTCLDRSQRASAGEILAHVWITNPPAMAARVNVLAEVMDSVVVNGCDHLTKKKWSARAVFFAVIFILKLAKASSVYGNGFSKSKRKIQGSMVLAAKPPTSSELIEILSRKSTETSSLFSNMEQRNQVLTLDGIAKRVRSENRLDELSPFFKYGGPGGSSASVFTAVGVSSSVAGQLSEMENFDSISNQSGVLNGRASASRPVRPAGPFLLALEAHLEADAFSSMSSDNGLEGDDEDDRTTQGDDDYRRQVLASRSLTGSDIPRLLSPSTEPPPPPPTAVGATVSSDSFDKLQMSSTEKFPGSSVSAFSLTMVSDEDDSHAASSPTSARAHAVQAWEALVRGDDDSVEEDSAQQQQQQRGEDVD